MGVREEQLLELSRFEESANFTEDEKLVLRLAVVLTRTPSDVPDELFAALRCRFSERELVELSVGKLSSAIQSDVRDWIRRLLQR